MSNRNHTDAIGPIAVHGLAGLDGHRPRITVSATDRGQVHVGLGGQVADLDRPAVEDLINVLAHALATAEDEFEREDLAVGEGLSVVSPDGVLALVEAITGDERLFDAAVLRVDLPRGEGGRWCLSLTEGSAAR